MVRAQSLGAKPATPLSAETARSQPIGAPDVASLLARVRLLCGGEGSRDHDRVSAVSRHTYDVALHSNFPQGPRPTNPMRGRVAPASAPAILTPRM